MSLSWDEVIKRWGPLGLVVAFLCYMLFIQSERQERLAQDILGVVKHNTQTQTELREAVLGLKEAVTGQENRMTQCCKDRP